MYFIDFIRNLRYLIIYILRYATGKGIQVKLGTVQVTKISGLAIKNLEKIEC